MQQPRDRSRRLAQSRTWTVHEHRVDGEQPVAAHGAERAPPGIGDVASARFGGEEDDLGIALEQILDRDAR